MNNFRENDILILIGAGCSKEAGIPTSVDMIMEIEKMINEKDEWKYFKDLYYFVKSCILYADGLNGKYSGTLNIERFINTLNELEKKEEHPIFPFIGSWNPKVVELCGSDFKKIKDFKYMIIDKLKSWVTLENYYNAKYYEHLLNFQKQLGFPLRIFSLNYDLCIEENEGDSIIELGFDENRIWQWQRFEKNENIEVNVYLYKMHGSINWERRPEGFLTYSDEINKIDKLDLIFGTNYKLQYIDPYLFYAHELRKYSLEANLIITIGYGYFDEHINGIICQALKSKKDIKLIGNVYDLESNDEMIKTHILKRLDIEPCKFEIVNIEASKFLENKLKLEELNKYVMKEDVFSNNKVM